MEIVIIILVCSLAVEAITEILTKASIFSGLQAWAKPGESFLQKAFSCPYCLSVWVAFFVFTPICISYTWNPAILIVGIFVTHRLANFEHHLFELLFWKALELKERNE